MLQKSGKERLIRKVTYTGAASIIDLTDSLEIICKSMEGRYYHIWSCIFPSLLVWWGLQAWQVTSRLSPPGGGSGHPQQAGGEGLHQAPRQARPLLHDGGRAQCDDEGLHPVEEAAQEGAQADSLLQDQKLADCGDGEHHLVRTTFFCSQCSVTEYTFIQLYSIYKMVKIIH